MKGIYWALFLVSAASLAFQVALTRFFALAQGSHLAFMAVSLALLGIGVSGAYLSLKPADPARLQGRIMRGAILFAGSLPLAYLSINYLPFDAYRLAWEPAQVGWMGLYYLVLAIPFFFSGLVVGAALAAQPARSGPIYAANLLGAGLGPPLALLALATVGGPGTIFLCALLGWLAVIGSQGLTHRPPSSTVHQGLPVKEKRWLALHLMILIALSYLTLQPPALFEVRLIPYKSLSQAKLYPGSEIIFSRWNAFSRVDVIRSEGVRSAPGLSFTYTGALPPQLGLMVDGDNLTPITAPTERAFTQQSFTKQSFTQHLPLALAFTLRPKADVLILEPGGGLAVLTALQSGARSVTLVQSNHTVTEAVTNRFADFNQRLYHDPRVTVISDEPRSFLRRTDRQFDLIILPLTDAFRAVTAGAYTLNEDYRYTVEAFKDSIVHLTPNGLLVVERWLQLPPTESLRLWGTAIEALRQSPPKDPNCDQADLTADACRALPADHLLALRSLQTSLIVAAHSPLSSQDLGLTRQFATTQQFDLIWLPDLQPDEANRYSIVPEAVYHQTFTDLLTRPNPAAFWAGYPFAVAPPTDDHPFFFHFFKWGQTPQIIEDLGKSWQPFGGSGYLVLIALLTLVIILSAGLILLPLLITTSRRPVTKVPADYASSQSPSFPAPPQPYPLPSKTLLARYLLYFTLLGLGFLFVEIPLLQRFILYLGQPAYAFAVVITALLVASGVGSNYLSTRLPLRLVLPLITLLTLMYPLLLPSLFGTTLRFPFIVRIGVTIVSLFPLGVLLGIPFPRGLALVEDTAPGLTPWVWAVNGCASVVSAITAVIIALTWGFSVVLWSAALAYALAGVSIFGVAQTTFAIHKFADSNFIRRE